MGTETHPVRNQDKSRGGLSSSQPRKRRLSLYPKARTAIQDWDRDLHDWNLQRSISPSSPSHPVNDSWDDLGCMIWWDGVLEVSSISIPKNGMGQKGEGDVGAQ